MQKVWALKQFLRFDKKRSIMHHKGSPKREALFLSSLGIRPHSDPEETGVYTGNLNNKLIEIILGIKKIPAEYNIKHDGVGNPWDSYILHKLGVTRNEVLSGEVKVIMWAEDSGLVFPEVNGEIFEIMCKKPELFGADLEPLVRGMVKDKYIAQSFEKGWPGVETATFLNAVGKEAAIRVIDKCGEILHKDTRPLTREDLSRALHFKQQSFLAYFLWYPGMSLDHRDLASLKYKTDQTSTEGIYTGRILDSFEPGHHFELDDVQIPWVNASSGDFRTHTELGYPYRGPLCRHNLFERMVHNVGSREFFKESVGDKIQAPSISPRRHAVAGDINYNGYDIALISFGRESGHESILNRLKTTLPRGYKVREFFTSEFLTAKSADELFQKMGAFSYDLLHNSDCVIFAPVPKGLEGAELAAVSSLIGEFNTHKLVSPLHRNKRQIFMNESGCYNDIIKTTQDMFNIGALAEGLEVRGEERLAKILPGVNINLLKQEIIKGSLKYERVDVNHGFAREPEKITPYIPEEDEIVTSIYCSAAMRGWFGDKARVVASNIMNTGRTVSWGLGDKISMMGSVMEAAGFMEVMSGVPAKVTGSSTKEIIAGETRSGKGVPGVDGRSYEALLARTLDLILSSHEGVFLTGGAGTLYELDCQTLIGHATGKPLPSVVATRNEKDPIHQAAQKRLGKGTEDALVHYVTGDIHKMIKDIRYLFKHDLQMPLQNGHNGRH